MRIIPVGIGKKGPGKSDVEALAARYANICNFNFASRLRIDPPTSADWNTPTDLSGNYNCMEVLNGTAPNFRDSVDGRVFSSTMSGTPTTATLTKDIGTTDSLWIHTRIRFNALGTSEVIIGRGKDGAGNGWSVLLYKKSTNVVQLAVFLTVPSSEIVSVDGVTTLEAGRWHNIDAVFTPGTGLTLYIDGVLDGTTANTKTSLRTSTVGLTVCYYNTDAAGRLNADMSRLIIGTKLPDASVIKTLSTYLGGFNGVLAQDTDPMDGLILGDEFIHAGGGYGWIPTVAMAGGG